MNKLLSAMAVLKKKEIKKKLAREVEVALKGINKEFKSKKLENKIRKISNELAALFIKVHHPSKKKSLTVKKEKAKKAPAVKAKASKPEKKKEA